MTPAEYLKLVVSHVSTYQLFHVSRHMIKQITLHWWHCTGELECLRALVEVLQANGISVSLDNTYHACSHFSTHDGSRTGPGGKPKHVPMQGSITTLMAEDGRIYSVALVPNDQHKHIAHLLFEVCSQAGKQLEVLHTDNVGKDRGMFHQLFQRIIEERDRQGRPVDRSAELLVM